MESDTARFFSAPGLSGLCVAEFSLGPHECEIERNIDSAAMVQLLWRDLVAAFDFAVLAKMRAQNPNHPLHYSLKCRRKFFGRWHIGPFYQIIRINITSDTLERRDIDI